MINKIELTAKPKTLGDYRDVCVALAGEGGRAVKFFDHRINQAPKGRDEMVIAHESQMMILIASLIKENPQ